MPPRTAFFFFFFKTWLPEESCSGSHAYKTSMFLTKVPQQAQGTSFCMVDTNGLPLASLLPAEADSPKSLGCFVLFCFPSASLTSCCCGEPGVPSIAAQPCPALQPLLSPQDPILHSSPQLSCSLQSSFSSWLVLFPLPTLLESPSVNPTESLP